MTVFNRNLDALVAHSRPETKTRVGAKIAGLDVYQG
jgi:hypothetical protein